MLLVLVFHLLSYLSLAFLFRSAWATPKMRESTTFLVTGTPLKNALKSSTQRQKKVIGSILLGCYPFDTCVDSRSQVWG